MKYNLADITVLDSYSDALSILEYETISGSIREMDNSLALVTLLQTIKENSSLFKTIISTEIGFLQDSIEANQIIQENITETESDEPKISRIEQVIKNCVLLSKLKDIFDDSTKTEHIIVYNSLTESTPETKAVEYFNEEMIALRNIVREEIRDFMSQYQSTTRDDANFESIKDISYSLSNLIIRLNKLSKGSMRKSASSFLSQKNLEDQFAFFSLFFQEHVPHSFNKVPNLISHQESNRIEANEDIIDAEVNDAEVEDEHAKGEDVEIQNINQEQIEEFKQSLQEVVSSVEKISEDIQSIKDDNLEAIQQSSPKNIDEDEIVEKIKHSLYAHNEENEQKISLLHERVELIDEKISDISNAVIELSKNFNSFIENQTNFTKLIKERYAIDI